MANAGSSTAPELTPKQLAEQWKRQGGLDALRKQLLQDFLASPDRDQLLSSLDTLLPTVLSSSTTLTRLPRKDRPSAVLRTLQQRVALREPVGKLEGELRSGKGKGKRVERELRRCLCEARGVPFVEEESMEEEVKPEVKAEVRVKVEEKAESYGNSPFRSFPILLFSRRTQARLIRPYSLRRMRQGRPSKRTMPRQAVQRVSKRLRRHLKRWTEMSRWRTLRRRHRTAPARRQHDGVLSHNLTSLSLAILSRSDLLLQSIRLRHLRPHKPPLATSTPHLLIALADSGRSRSPHRAQSAMLSRSQSRQEHDEGHELPRQPSLFVVRSSDGAEFGLLPEDFRDVSTLGELKYNLLSPLLSIPPECLILMNEEGSPLNRDEAVQHLALLANTPASSAVLTPRHDGAGSTASARGMQPGVKRIYVFDREHLDADPEEVAAALAVTEEAVLTEPPLNPEDPLHSHLSLSLHNLQTLHALISAIQLQHASLALALSNLHRVNTGTASSFSLFLESAQPTMQRYENLLTGWEESMDAVGKVAIVARLLMRHASSGNSVHAREGSTSSVPQPEKQRYLGDYVSRDKMLAVRDGCAKVLAELKLRSEALQATLDGVVAGTEAVQADLGATKLELQDLEACQRDAEQGHMRIEELVHAGQEMSDPDLRASCFEELSVCDAEHRDRIRFLVERKNAMTRYLLNEMQKISTLQSDIATMPSELGALDHDLRTRTDNFKHLARLEGLIPAYVATVAEVVRRREYARLLSGQSVKLSSTFSPLSTRERERRVRYRQDYFGKLPWEVRGLGNATDERVPEMALDVMGRDEGLPELEKDALDKLANSFRDLDDALAGSPNPDNPIRKARALLTTLISDIEALCQDFERISLDQPPPRPPSADFARIAELQAQLRQLEETNDSLSRELQTERSAREEEVAQLDSRASTAENARMVLQRRFDSLERDKSSVEQSHQGIVARSEDLERRLTAESRRSETLERDLAGARVAEGELRKQWTALDQSHTRLQGELGTLRLELDRARSTIAEQEAKLVAAEESQRELTLAIAEKDRLLRDHRSEAELDRAVLEKEAAEAQRGTQAKEQELEDARRHGRLLEEAIDGLKEQIGRWEKVAQAKEDDLLDIRKAVEGVKAEKERALVDADKVLRKMTDLARGAITLAGRLRDENNKITAILNTPPPAKVDGGSSEVDKAAVDAHVPAVPALDYASGDLEGLLTELEKYNHDTLTDAVKNKVDSLTSVTKKWVKEAKAYRERAHRAASGANDKIAFRNFAKGDLALFLPTRNSAVPVWAAFNVSFPHHFLSASGVIAEQMKTREWIVARITSLTEKVVDPKDPSTNPYLLAPGTKYYTLEVEPWSSKESSRARRHSAPDKGKGAEKKSNGKESRVLPGGDSETLASRSMSHSAAESAILVDKPAAIAASVPSIRRSVSEGIPLPPNATALARSEFTIPEADEDPHLGSRTPSPHGAPVSYPTLRDDTRFASPFTSPSGLARALARSTSTSPTAVRSDPFGPSSPATPNPFPNSSAPAADSPLRQRSETPPVTDYDPSHTASGAAPAFLPTSGKKAVSSAGSASGSTSASHSPRYIRPAPRGSALAGRNEPARASQAIVSGSPASTTTSSLNAAARPRSVSSGSSILSSSVHRRAASTAYGDSGVSPPPLTGAKAPSTAEAQLTNSRWNLLQDDLASPSPSSQPRPVTQTATLGRKTTKGWPNASPSNGSPPSISPSARSPRRTSTLGTSGGSASILEVITGRKASSSPRKESSVSSMRDARMLASSPVESSVPPLARTQPEAVTPPTKHFDPKSRWGATEVTPLAVDDKGKSARLHYLSAGPAKREADEPASPSTPAVSFLEPLATPASTGLRSTTAFEDEEGTRSAAEEEDEDLRDGTTVLPLEDNENRRSFRRPGTPPFSPSQSSFRTDRLSVQSTTVTDFSDCSPSPSPSIGSVRMAQITKIPHRPYAPRMSLGATSILSESVEDAPEDTEEAVVWDTKALSRRSHMDRLPEDLAAILRAKDDPEQSTSTVTPDLAGEHPSGPGSNHSHETLAAKIPPSYSQNSLVSTESWKARLEGVADQISADPADRMKSILGLKVKVISKAPWDDSDLSRPAQPPATARPKLLERKSLDMLTTVRVTIASSDAPVVTSAPTHGRSFSAFTRRSAKSDERNKERDDALRGLGLNIGLPNGLAASESKRSLKSVFGSSSPPVPHSDSYPDVGAASLAAYAGKVRPGAARSESATKATRAAKNLAPVVFDSKAPGFPLASPIAAMPPVSAPPTVTLFGRRALPPSESKISLPVSSDGSAPSTPGPCTPSASTILSPPGGSYFAAKPGAPSSGRITPGGFNHKLISLEEARLRESERSAAAQRKAASTPPLEAAVRSESPRGRPSAVESIPMRRGISSPSAISTSPVLAASAPTPKALKPKKSGFLKRMMGVADKHAERPAMPLALQASISSSPSVATLDTASASAPATMSRSAGPKLVASIPPSASNTRITFSTPPAAEGSERVRRVPAPTLSLRPVSMAFSASLPSDFLAAGPAARALAQSLSPPGASSFLLSQQPASLSPPSSTSPLSEPLHSPRAASFKSSVSPTTPSLFDEHVAASGTTTPMTPAFSLSFPSHEREGECETVPFARYVALQEEFAKAKKAWLGMQYELEGRVKELVGEVEKATASAREREKKRRAVSPVACCVPPDKRTALDFNTLHSLALLLTMDAVLVHRDGLVYAEHPARFVRERRQAVNPINSLISSLVDGPGGGGASSTSSAASSTTTTTSSSTTTRRRVQRRAAPLPRRPQPAPNRAPRHTTITSVITPTTVIVVGTSTITSSLPPITSASTRSLAPTSSAAASSGGLSTGAKVGIGVGAAAGGLALLALLAFLCLGVGRRRKEKRDAADNILWPATGDSAALYPEPVHNTGRAGFGVGDDGDEVEDVAGAGARGSGGPGMAEVGAGAAGLGAAGMLGRYGSTSSRQPTLPTIPPSVYTSDYSASPYNHYGGDGSSPEGASAYTGYSTQTPSQHSHAPLAPGPASIGYVASHERHTPSPPRTGSASADGHAYDAAGSQSGHLPFPGEPEMEAPDRALSPRPMQVGDSAFGPGHFPLDSLYHSFRLTTSTPRNPHDQHPPTFSPFSRL
ncbi:Autophagy-related protein 11 [Rhodotorula toruloides]|nr:Autophagy-related protein 11 [Rhodotorula toruloides]